MNLEPVFGCDQDLHRDMVEFVPKDAAPFARK